MFETLATPMKRRAAVTAAVFCLAAASGGCAPNQPNQDIPFPATLGPIGPNDIDCDEISLTFAHSGDRTETVYCRAGDDRGRNGGSLGATGLGTRWETMGLESGEKSIIMQVIIANRHTTIQKFPVKSVVDGYRWFTQSQNWGEVYQVDGYEVQPFEGTWKGALSFWNCVGFSRYARPINGTPGYAERLTGTYCVPTGAPLHADTLAEFLASIRY